VEVLARVRVCEDCSAFPLEYLDSPDQSSARRFDAHGIEPIVRELYFKGVSADRQFNLNDRFG
jgi:hypothetical protein